VARLAEKAAMKTCERYGIDPPPGTGYKGDFTYDGLGRLRVRTSYGWNGSSWYVSVVEHYIYDGMRCIYPVR
jgi:hypothetical protein